MADRPSMPAAAPLPSGEITRVSVTYTVTTGEGRWRTIHGLKIMRDHARPDRVADVVDDLAVICEEVLAARPSAGGLPAGVVRVPFERPVGRREAACRDLLAAVCEALDCPPPADAAAESVFLRLCSDRSRLAVAALRPVLADRESGPAHMAKAARRLRDRVAACPADGYAHSPLCS
jgi:hypothetical protein